MIATKKMILSAGLFWIVSNTCLSQNIELTGVIKCEQTRDVLSNSLVRVGDFFTYSNGDGEFVLTVPNEVAKELEIYHMGYDGYSSEIEKGGRLYPYVINLNKVQPKPTGFNTGADVMKEVFNRFHVNYEVEDQLMLAYYKETLTAQEKIYHFAEGVVEIHIPSNVEKGPARLKPLKTRVKSTTDFKHGGLYDKSGHASEMIKSSAFADFLSKKSRWSYNYRLIGKEVHRNENVFIIDFSPMDENGYVQGRLWVDEFTYAIIRIEYNLAQETAWDSETWVEEFQHHNHTYRLMRASFEGHWTEEGKPYVFNSMVVNTRIEANREDQIAFDGFIKGSEFTFLDKSHGSFTDDYWDGYNYIKLTAAERAQIR